MDLIHKYQKLKGSFESCFCCILGILSDLTFKCLELIVSAFGREAVLTDALLLIILQGQDRQSLKTRLPQNLRQPLVEMARVGSTVVSEATGTQPVSSPAPRPKLLHPYPPPDLRSPVTRNCAASPLASAARLESQWSLGTWCERQGIC